MNMQTHYPGTKHPAPSNCTVCSIAGGPYCRGNVVCLYSGKDYIAHLPTRSRPFWSKISRQITVDMALPPHMPTVVQTKSTNFKF